MQELSNQVTGGTLTADEFNEIPEELENVILSIFGGGSLSEFDLQQVVKSVSAYSGCGNFYSDSGAADAYVLSAIAPRIAIDELLEGMHIRFTPANTNTGPSTVNVNSIGAVDLLNQLGLPLSGGEVVSGVPIEVVYDGTNLKIYKDGGFSKGHLYDLNIQNNSVDPDNDLDFLPGQCRDISDQIDIVVDSTITKRLDATWAEGDSAGGLAAGASVGNSETVHAFVLGKVNGEFDAGFDDEPDGSNLLADAAVISAGYTHLRRAGSLVTDSSGNLFLFTQSGDHFYYLDEVLNFDINNFGTSAVIQDVYIPSRINAVAILDSEASGSFNDPDIRISPVAGPDLAPTSSNATFSVRTSATVQSTQHMLPVDHSGVTNIGQIRIRSTQSSVSNNLNSTSIGWIDKRDRS